eukprot:4491603-Amphidinium_carterae.1
MFECAGSVASPTLDSIKTTCRESCHGGRAMEVGSCHVRVSASSTRIPKRGRETCKVCPEDIGP